MTSAALKALAASIIVAAVTYTLGFRRSFIRIPETSDTGPLPQMRFSFPFFTPLQKLFLRTPSQRGSFRFAIATLLRSEAHLQIFLAFAALGLVAAAESLNTPLALGHLLTQPLPPTEFLAVPFVLVFCFLAGIRFAFEMPADLRASWIFKLWIDCDSQEARPIARRVLHALTLSWLAPATFAVTLLLLRLAKRPSPHRHPHRRHDPARRNPHRKLPQNPLHLPVPAIRKHLRPDRRRLPLRLLHLHRLPT